MAPARCRECGRYLPGKAAKKGKKKAKKTKKPKSSRKGKGKTYEDDQNSYGGNDSYRGGRQGSWH